MSGTSRLQFNQGNHPSFSFKELPSPTRNPCKSKFEGEPIFDKVEEDKSVTWYNLISYFSSSFDIMLDTPRAKNSVSFTMNQEERLFFLYEFFHIRREDISRGKKDAQDKQARTRARETLTS